MNQLHDLDPWDVQLDDDHLGTDHPDHREHAPERTDVPKELRDDWVRRHRASAHRTGVMLPEAQRAHARRARS